MAFPHPDLTPWRPVDSDSVCFGSDWYPDFGEIKPPLNCAAQFVHRSQTCLYCVLQSPCALAVSIDVLSPPWETSRFVDPNPSRRRQLKAFSILARVSLVSLDPLGLSCSDAFLGVFTRFLGLLAVRGFHPFSRPFQDRGGPRI